MRYGLVGKTVYVVYQDEVYQDEVFAVGEEVFLTKSFDKPVVRTAWELRYEDEGRIWFPSLNALKEALNGKLEPLGDKWWRMVG